MTCLQLKWVLGSCLFLFAATVGAQTLPQLFGFEDSTGEIATYNTAGAIKNDSAFFKSLGTNGRSCATCHRLDNAMSFTSATARTLFGQTGGNDPLFADVDGTNCAGLDRHDASAHSLLLNNGLIHLSLPVPAKPEFTIHATYDPYGCAVEGTAAARQLSVYRRPLPSTNLRFLSAMMFDGRETIAPLNDPSTFSANLVTDLTHQAVDATLGHAQALAAPTAQQQADIVRFELSLFTAQTSDRAADSLSAQGASGGPSVLSQQPYYPGINDSLGANPTGTPFTSETFTLFGPWTDLHSAMTTPFTAAREKIAAGEAIFDNFPLTITNVGGLNDVLNRSSIAGTCSTCHDTPNIGNHSLPVPLDIGVSHSPTYETDPDILAALAQLSLPDLPVFQVTCTSGRRRTVFTTDPGKALISGHCVDLNRVKGPILRGLSARAPYFHNGSARTLVEVVNFYNERFGMQLTSAQKEQLVAFLQSL